MSKPVAVTLKHRLPIKDSGHAWAVDLVDRPDEVMLKDVQSKANPLIVFDIVAIDEGGKPRFMPSNIRYPKWSFSIDDINRIEDSLSKKREFCPRCKSLEEVLQMMYEIKRGVPPTLGIDSPPAPNPTMMSPPDGVGPVHVKTYERDIYPDDIFNPVEMVVKVNNSVEDAVNQFQRDVGEFAENWLDRILNPFDHINKGINKSRPL